VRESGARELLTWFYGVDGDDGELVDYHELDDFEAASIERSKALASTSRRRWTCRWLSRRCGRASRAR